MEPAAADGEEALVVKQHINLWLKPRLKSRSEAWLNVDLEREPFAWQEGRGGWPITSQVMICPFCLDQWAILVVEGKDYHRPDGVSCTLCARSTDSHPIPGSLLDIPGTGAIDCTLLDALPESLVKREFDLHLKAAFNVHNG